VPTETYSDTDSQRYLLSAVRESQAIVVDAIRIWSTVAQQLTRNLRLPVPGVDLAGIVDRTFDVAEQTLAAQRQLALTLAGAASRQVDTAVEALDTAMEAVDTTAETVQATVREPEPRDRERVEQAAAAKAEAPKAEPAKGDTATDDRPKSQPRKPDRRTYEERSVEELRERARELDIEGRSTMSKDELVAALRKHSR